jgi:flagellar biosynthetic protein FliQ
MTDITVLQLFQKALLLTLEVSAPILGLSLLAGLVVSIFQAATQIQEMTLSFIPKILAMAGALIVFGPWMLRVTMSFTSNLLIDLPKYVR